MDGIEAVSDNAVLMLRMTMLIAVGERVVYAIMQLLKMNLSKPWPLVLMLVLAPFVWGFNLPMVSLIVGLPSIGGSILSHYDHVCLLLVSSGGAAGMVNLVKSMTAAKADMKKARGSV